MSKKTATFTTNTTTLLGSIQQNRTLVSCELFIFGYGTWGGGTIALYWSPDAGTTKIAMNDLTETALTKTANFGSRASFVSGTNSDGPILVYGTLTGSSGASLTIGFYDNN